ncbi:MAG: hypothetical protein U5K79_22375 [Cyclobacteriaceae bacterium]|nr:hypothetical protein [Cyclobacteriaceae bacterium]
MENLAESILNQDEFYVTSSDEDQIISRRMTTTILRRKSSDGIRRTNKAIFKYKGQEYFSTGLIRLRQSYSAFEKPIFPHATMNEAAAMRESCSLEESVSQSVESREHLPSPCGFLTSIGDCSKFPESMNVTGQEPLPNPLR